MITKRKKGRIGIVIYPTVVDIRVYRVYTVKHPFLLFERRISEVSYALPFRPLLTRRNYEYLAMLGPKGKSLVTNLLTIKGISGVYVNSKEVTVFKSSRFKWEEIEPKIIEILERIY